ncbi:c-type heme family protein [Methylicorpusculum sp.]|uniref:ATP-binding protein n=1 Tax=Methylicorpusculum sp. TaxID=2713644 RepID=UPI0027303952|nr:DUF3365 domain-containing protein [Methylicorpusculum sp.]MDP2180280.1 DUF3365 domain-containing protein [Methylicorpusculum sp.]MDP3528117.1 DUF3365 domain-containing protein [Methylicorpusculum sp.]MDZ4154221.1 DUF3365 domain-containing protein [Methylicorpusculum sp.]
MKEKTAIDAQLRRVHLPLLLLMITMILAASLYFRISSVRHHNLEVTTVGARNIFQIIVLTRQWNAEHQGVYALVSADTQPNPYLEHPDRDLELADKRRLTMINPAYMTRQIADLAMSDEHLNLHLHITSLKPIRPENGPDDWEALALKEFEEGKSEKFSIEIINDQSYLRYMAPLAVKQPCLACHAKQGYKLGDVRGGISVSMPYQAIEQATQNEIMATVINHGFFYVLLVTISWVLIELLARRWRSLDDTIMSLEATRTELIATEKMASLGRLVAGFAHELNTPVGVAVGAISHSDETIKTLKQLLTLDEVSEIEFSTQIDYLSESHDLALANLRRAADLVQRFKRTSIDRGSEHKREFQLAELIQDVLTTLRNVLKKTAIKVDVDCDPLLKLYGAPGLLEQILTNLITNSVTHGFDEGRRTGRILIKTFKNSDGKLVIDYQDDGAGMNDEVCRQAFEPFFTTRRDCGGSGLGLYVIYTIVTHQMAGAINIKARPGLGSHIHIECPIENPPNQGNRYEANPSLKP